MGADRCVAYADRYRRGLAKSSSATPSATWQVAIESLSSNEHDNLAHRQDPGDPDSAGNPRLNAGQLAWSDNRLVSKTDAAGNLVSYSYERRHRIGRCPREWWKSWKDAEGGLGTTPIHPGRFPRWLEGLSAAELSVLHPKSAA